MRIALLIGLGLGTACTGASQDSKASGTTPDCRAVIVRELPATLNEVSGIAASLRTDGVFWVHNDGGPALLYGLDSTGTILARVRVPVKRNIDWEDIAAAPCSEGSCLYIGQIGDNRQRRALRTIHRLAEPTPDDSLSAVPVSYQFRTPGISHDAEAIVVLPDDELYLITKGRSGPVTVFAFPKPLQRGSPMELTEIATLSDGLVQLPDMVTGAAVVPGTRIAAVRTYGGIQFYRVENRSFVPLYDRPYDLRSLNEPQGEGVTVRADGSILLVSERALGKAALLSRIQCTLPE